MANFKPYIDINIDPTLEPEERELLAFEIIDHIINRSEKGLDKNGKPFANYSESYIESEEFKAFGKSPNKVNATLSGEMLNAMDLLSHKIGQIRIGYDSGDTRLIGKVEGNVLGTYGQKTPIKGKQRDFLGIKSSEVKELEANYIEQESNFNQATGSGFNSGSGQVFAAKKSFANNVKTINQDIDFDIFNFFTNRRSS